MRTGFVNALTELARKDKNIFLLTGDLGFSVFESFKKEFSDRFFDVGVAEQNMIGIAAGLALSGKKVFVYSIIPFVTMRCLEHIRVDLCERSLDVKIIGMGAGLDYGFDGFTHYAVEDLGIMRSLINMTVVSPSSPREAERAVKAASKYNGPVYIRLSKSSDLTDVSDSQEFQIGKGIMVKGGRDVTIISTGSMLSTAKRVTEILGKKGINSRLINLHTIKPIDKEIILQAASETPAIFTLEEHCIIGGVGSAVAEVLAESLNKVLFKKIGLPNSFIKEVGSRDYLLKKYNLSEEAISGLILKEMKLRGKK